MLDALGRGSIFLACLFAGLAWIWWLFERCRVRGRFDAVGVCAFMIVYGVLLFLLVVQGG